MLLPQIPESLSVKSGLPKVISRFPKPAYDHHSSPTACLAPCRTHRTTPKCPTKPHPMPPDAKLLVDNKGFPMIIAINEENRKLFPPSIRKQAGIQLGDEWEILVSGKVITLFPKLPADDDKLTSQQRRRIDSRLTNASKEVQQGKTIGPFESAAEMVASMKSELRKRAAAKRATRAR